MRNTKDYILGVAFKLFMQKNYKEVTMKEIVEKTGLSKGAFYHYFESKEKLFLEILHHFFSTVMNIDYDQYSKESLYQFYHDCLNEKDEFRIEFRGNEEKFGDSYFNMNFFFLIFDGLKLSPGYRKSMEDFQERELKAWTTAIKRARENGEIKSVMSDQHIAMIFIHTSDGVAMNLVLGGGMKNLKKELCAIWDEFYESLKA
jgi:TetR/AcrR family transcriptional repressor of nem operon